MNLPIIKLEVEHMRQSMCIALSEYTAQLDAMLKEAVDQFCTPENLQHIVQTETTRVLDQVIREEVKRWFVYGDGRAAIRASVEQRLKEDRTYTPLDSNVKKGKD